MGTKKMDFAAELTSDRSALLRLMNFNKLSDRSEAVGGYGQIPSTIISNKTVEYLACPLLASIVYYFNHSQPGEAYLADTTWLICFSFVTS